MSCAHSPSPLLHDFEGRQRMRGRQKHGKTKCVRHHTTDSVVYAGLRCCCCCFLAISRNKSKQYTTRRRYEQSEREREPERGRERRKYTSYYGTRVVIWVRYTPICVYKRCVCVCISSFAFIVQLYCRDCRCFCDASLLHVFRALECGSHNKGFHSFQRFQMNFNFNFQRFFSMRNAAAQQRIVEVEVWQLWSLFHMCAHSTNGSRNERDSGGKNQCYYNSNNHFDCDRYRSLCRIACAALTICYGAYVTIKCKEQMRNTMTMHIQYVSKQRNNAPTTNTAAASNMLSRSSHTTPSVYGCNVCLTHTGIDIETRAHQIKCVHVYAWADWLV